MQHVTFDIDLVDKNCSPRGRCSTAPRSPAGKRSTRATCCWCPTHSPRIDPFYQQTTLFLFCDILNPDSGEPYNRDPRMIAKKAEPGEVEGVGDTVYFGPEAEFFVFDDVR